MTAILLENNLCFLEFQILLQPNFSIINCKLFTSNLKLYNLHETCMIVSRNLIHTYGTDDIRSKNYRKE